MQIPNEQKSISVKCYVNGSLRTLTLQESHVLFWCVPFGWLLPIDWCRFGKNSDYIRELITKSIKMFAYNLLTRGYTALSINSECMLDEHDYAPSRNVFQARAYKLAKVFGKNIPFVYDEDFDYSKKLQPAYRMVPGQKWMIVIGLAPESEIEPSEVDWTFFQTPPDGKEKEAVVKVLVEKGYL